jgi:hypothetical protein
MKIIRNEFLYFILIYAQLHINQTVLHIFNFSVSSKV